MPYFERKLWQETGGGLQGPDPAGTNDDVGLAELAQSILDAETGPQHALDGPFRCRNPVQAGEGGVIVLSVSADGNGDPVTLDLSPGDLRSRGGQTIPANLMRLEPNHLTITPGGSQSFEVHILVPLDCDPGLYSGRVIGSGPEPVSFVVEVDVARPTDV